MIKRFLVCLCVGLAGVMMSAGNRSWEEMQQEQSAQVERAEMEQIEVSVKDGYVYINTPRNVTVKIFSILGQLISQEEIPAGTYRMRIASRGIYILKAGPVTRRITI